MQTESPINKAVLTTQNIKLLEYLKAGNKINCFSPSREWLNVGYLNSRISDLIKSGIAIKKEWTKAVNADGKIVKVMEYSL